MLTLKTLAPGEAVTIQFTDTDVRQGTVLKRNDRTSNLLSNHYLVACEGKNIVVCWNSIFNAWAPYSDR